MGTEDDIRIDLKSDISGGEKARKKLAEVESQVEQLRSSFEQGNVATARYNQELKNLERQADRARAALDRIKPAATGRLTGAERAGAISRAGLLGANTLQDVIQGGPASGINNILGAAQDKGIKALAGEALQAAGGLRVVAAGLGTIALAAGAAFLVVDTGLKSAKLGWSDLGNVVTGSSPWKAVSETLGGLGAVLEESGINAGLRLMRDQLYEDVEAVADLTLGWDAATESARQQRLQVELGVKAAREYVEAVKALSAIKSPEQAAAQERGKVVGGQLAGLGGEGGLGALAEKLADVETKRSGKDANGKDRTVKVRKLNDKGEDDGEEEITRREAARRRIQLDLFRAAQGDTNALARLKAQIDHAGIDSSRLTGLAPADRDKEREAEKKAQQEELDETFDEAMRDKSEKERVASEKEKREAKDAEVDEAVESAEKAGEESEKIYAKHATERAEKATAGTGFSAKIDDALIREALKSGGAPGVATKAVADQISRELQSRGIDQDSADAAGKAMAAEHATKLGDKIHEDAMNPAKALAAPSHIGVGDFARSVESAGADKLLTTTEAMRDKLTELVRQGEQGARAAP